MSELFISIGNREYELVCSRYQAPDRESGGEAEFDSVVTYRQLDEYGRYKRGFPFDDFDFVTLDSFIRDYAIDRGLSESSAFSDLEDQMIQVIDSRRAAGSFIPRGYAEE